MLSDFFLLHNKKKKHKRCLMTFINAVITQFVQLWLTGAGTGPKMQYHPWNVWALRKQRLYGDGWGIILEIEHLFYAVNIPDTLPSSSTLCYLKGTKSSFWDTSEMCCYMSGGSIVLSGHKQLWCITGTNLAPIIMLFYTQHSKSSDLRMACLKNTHRLSL